MGFFTPVLLLLLCTSFVSSTSVKIKNADQLIALFAEETGAALTTDIELEADLDFSKSTVRLTDPLGRKSQQGCTAYQGVFHGNGHAIKDLVIDKRSNDTFREASLFCTLKNAAIENLVIDESCFFAGSNAGALSVLALESLNITNVTNKASIVTKANSAGFIGMMGFVSFGITLWFTDCVNEGNVNASGGNIGGFIGYLASSNNAAVKISNCTNNGVITGSSNVGGFLGFTENNEHVSLIISNSMNHGNFTGSFHGGGFVGAILNNTGINIVISDCTNNGAATNSRDYTGGFVGDIELNENMLIHVANSTNYGVISGTDYLGGCFGALKNNTDIKTSNIFNFTNHADVSGHHRVGGIVGAIEKCYNAFVEINLNVNTGAIKGAQYNGGIVGRLQAVIGTSVTVNNSKNSGSVSGENYIGGLIGNAISDSPKNSLTLTVANSANKGFVASSNGIACGLYCGDRSQFFQVTSSVVNSINRGKVTGTMAAYGITNKAPTAKNNIVNMGEVTNQPDYYTFWPCDIEGDADTLYGMEKTCVNCPKNTTFFVRDTTDGLYKTNGTNERVDELLNRESHNRDHGAEWSNGLFITTRLVDVFVGGPLNTVVQISGEQGLEELEDLCSVFMPDCVVVNNKTKQPLDPLSEIEPKTTVIFCHKVTTSGAVQYSWNVEHGTPLENVTGFAQYCDSKHILSNASNRKQPLTCATRVNEALHVVISRANTVEVVISPDHEMTEEDVEDALDDVLEKIGDTPSQVDVVPNGDGSYIISITIPEDDTTSVVGALEKCI